MRRRNPALLLGLFTLVIIVAAACGASNTSGGVTFTDSRKAVAGAEGLFQRGESSASVLKKATDSGLEFRKLEVKDFIGGTRRTVIVTPDTGQQWEAFIFLPPTAGADGTMVVVKRSDDTVQAVYAWDCAATKIFLEQGNITDFTNDACS